MHCSRVRRRLSGLVDEELTDTERKQVAHHLAGCVDCTRVVDELRLLKQAAKTLARRDPPDGLFESTLRSLEEAPRHNWRWLDSWRSLGSWRLLAVPTAMTAVAICVGTTLVISDHVRDRAPLGDPRVAHAAQRDRELLDGASREFRRAELHYRKAVRRLRLISERESRRWDKGRRDRLTSRLAVIDRAIVRFRRATAFAPADSKAHDLLFAAYRQQISELRGSIFDGLTRPEEAP